MEVIKKAYQQEAENEEGEVSPREVGHNIYILALQVDHYIIKIYFGELFFMTASPLLIIFILSYFVSNTWYAEMIFNCFNCIWTQQSINNQ